MKSNLNSILLFAGLILVFSCQEELPLDRRSEEKLKITEELNEIQQTVGLPPMSYQQISDAIIYPNGGEIIQQFHRYPIRWRPGAFSGSYVQIWFYCGGVLHHQIVNATPNSGEFEFNEYPFQVLCSDAKIKISEYNQNPIDYDFSDATFSVVDASHSTVGVIAPNGFETWSGSVNMYPFVKWRPAFFGAKTDNVKIELWAFAGGNWNLYLTLEPSTPNDGIQTMNYMTWGGYYSKYKIRISALVGSSVDESDSEFYEVGYNTPQSVYSPYELQSISSGLYLVRWNQELFDGEVTLEVYKDGVMPPGGLPVSSANDGEEYMSFPGGLGCAKVKIYRGSIYHWSDYCVKVSN
jgi:hypothetical protein